MSLLPVLSLVAACQTLVGTKVDDRKNWYAQSILPPTPINQAFAICRVRDGQDRTAPAGAAGGVMHACMNKHGFVYAERH